MIVATALVCAAELWFVLLLVSRYSSNIDLNEFLFRAPLDKVLLAQHHARTALIMFQMSTVLATMRAST